MHGISAAVRGAPFLKKGRWVRVRLHRFPGLERRAAECVAGWTIVGGVRPRMGGWRLVIGKWTAIFTQMGRRNRQMFGRNWQMFGRICRVLTRTCDPAG